MDEILEKEKQIRLSLFKITHEIKNPIAVCKAYLDMFDTNNLEHSRKYIPIIKNEIERILVLLQDFLLVNKTNMNCDIMDINMLIEEVTEKVTSIMDSNDIKFNIKTTDDGYTYTNAGNTVSDPLQNATIEVTELALSEKVTAVYTIKNGESDVAALLADPVITVNSAAGTDLSKYFNVTATFFVNGGLFGQPLYNDKILEFLVNNGYDIGNHTYTHVNFSKASIDEIQKEIGIVNNMVESLLDGYKI
mgnify:CR=1 FL=1